jgi:hypothetical protein
MKKERSVAWILAKNVFRKKTVHISYADGMTVLHLGTKVLFKYRPF